MQLPNHPVTELFRRMWAYAAGRRGLVVLELLLVGLATVAMLIEPLLIARVFNSIQSRTADAELVRFLTANLLFILALHVCATAVHKVGRVIERMSEFHVRRAYRRAMLAKVFALPAVWHRDHHSGETINKINTAAGALGGFTVNMFTIVENTVRLVGSLIALAFFDWRTTLLVLVGTVVMLVVLARFNRKLVEGYGQNYRFSNAIASSIHDAISNIFTVITLRLQHAVEGEIDRRERAPRPLARRLAILDETKWFSSGVVISLITTLVLILYVRTTYAATGVIVIGTLFALYSYVGTVGGVFHAMAHHYGAILQQASALRSAEPIEHAHARLAPPDSAVLPHGWKEIRVEDLSFSYAGGGAGASPFRIEGVGLRLRRGERIAFVGASGAGKSTVLMLLRGLYRAHAAVTCDGARLPHGLVHLGEHVTLVPQDPEIFNATVEQNVTMGVTHPEEEVLEALRLAQFLEVAQGLPHGIHTNVVEKGVSLSGGQRQRLALARGLLAARASEILLLDEPTSSVDALTEAAIYEGIFTAMPDATVVSTVHRLHLLQQFDRVYFFADARLAAEGTFDELRANPAFEALWQRYLKSFEKKAAAS